MSIKLDDLVPSYERFFESFRAVRICPRRIEASEETLSFNTLTLAIALVIFMIARSTTTADNDTLTLQVVAMVISALITFASGYIALIFASGDDGVALSKRWTTFFVHIWLGSLIALILIDGIAVWTERHRLSTILIDLVFVPGALSEVQKDAIRAVLFTSVAICILLIKTKRQDAGFTLSCKCWIAAAVLALILNSALLLAFVYGNVL